MADRIGQQLGNYRLVRLLGQGGYAEVYLGQHLRLNQQAAIKVLHTHLTVKEAEHFQQEAQTISRLVHSAIVRVFDYDVQEGIPFLVMDYAPNGTLRRLHPQGDVVSLSQIVSYVKQVAAALHYAHEHKVVHRDVKPENMLLGWHEEVLLSDFGIATVAHSTGSLSAEAAVGTIAYMAPEQIQGHPRPASDQYALAVTVYEWLCGQRPFEGSFTELVTQHLWQPPPSLQNRAPTITLAVEQVVLRALAKDPKERFASVVAGGILGSLSLLAHFGVLGAHSGSTTPVVRGGTWTDDFWLDLYSLLPNGSPDTFDAMVADALYLPLFYGDAQGVVHAGAATEVPTLSNGGISADAKTWTFHLRPHLVWSDGQPYDARDVDYTWQLWKSPKFGAAYPQGVNLISSADVSADHLSITFHLTQAYAPFLQFWVDGDFAPLPSHHFSGMAPEAILKSPENLNPKVTSGPFLMAESKPCDHYTLVRNPRYYRASEGLPYLDKLIFRIADPETILQDLQAGTITSAWNLDITNVQAYQRLSNYTLTPDLTIAGFEGIFFTFHNTVLASRPEVRQAMAMAIDHLALIQVARHGFASQLCTDHGSFYHPGYEPTAGCPPFDPAAANKLLSDNGWVKGTDGVRTKGGQRLEFEYSTNVTHWSFRLAVEAIIQRNFRAIGIQLDIQNYDGATLFGHILPEGKASPPSGAIAGRYDVAEFFTTPSFGYDPDDSSLLSCDQIPPKGSGSNLDFYCNHTLDALYRQEEATAEQGARQQLFGQIHQIYLTELPFIVLFGNPDVSIVRKGAHNYSPSTIAGESENIWEWWCDKGKC